MKTVTVKDCLTGRLTQVQVSDEVYDFLVQAGRTDETQQRIDRSRLVKEELSDYHQNILLRPQRLMSEEVEVKLLIEQMLDALGSLSAYERHLIQRRFFEKATLTEIARESGVTYQVVQRKIERVIEKLSGTVNL